MKPPHIIEQKLAEIGKTYPMLNKSVNVFLQGKGVTFPDWPSCVFLPLASWCAIVARTFSWKLLLDERWRASELAAFGTWRYSQGVYRFDADLFEALVSTPYDTIIPVDVIQRLPQFCCYIETAGKLETTQEGFFAFLEYNQETYQLELGLQVLYDTGKTVPVYLPLKKDKNINEFFKEIRDKGAIDVEDPNIPEESRDLLVGDRVDYASVIIKKMLPLVLYLCSDKPDIDNLWEPGKHPSNPAPKKVKGNRAKLFPAQKPTIWEVGKNIGQALRNAAAQKPEYAGGTHASPKAHVRRGHWHGYWTGPRKGDRVFVLKWLHPMLVNMDK